MHFHTPVHIIYAPAITSPHIFSPKHTHFTQPCLSTTTHLHPQTHTHIHSAPTLLLYHFYTDSTLLLYRPHTAFPPPTPTPSHPHIHRLLVSLSQCACLWSPYGLRAGMPFTSGLCRGARVGSCSHPHLVLLYLSACLGLYSPSWCAVSCTTLHLPSHPNHHQSSHTTTVKPL